MFKSLVIFKKLCQSCSWQMSYLYLSWIVLTKYCFSHAKIAFKWAAQWKQGLLFCSKCEIQLSSNMRKGCETRNESLSLTPGSNPAYPFHCLFCSYFWRTLNSSQNREQMGTCWQPICSRSLWHTHYIYTHVSLLTSSPGSRQPTCLLSISIQTLKIRPRTTSTRQPKTRRHVYPISYLRPLYRWENMVNEDTIGHIPSSADNARRHVSNFTLSRIPRIQGIVQI